jgi:hypothetical protein
MLLLLQVPLKQKQSKKQTGSSPNMYTKFQ